jgi:excisionase family DNA binding protein
MTADYSVQELARLVGIGPETVRRLARSGRLRGAYKIGGQWRFAREDVDLLRRPHACSDFDLADIDVAACMGAKEETPADAAGVEGERT